MAKQAIPESERRTFEYWLKQHIKINPETYTERCDLYDNYIHHAMYLRIHIVLSLAKFVDTLLEADANISETKYKGRRIIRGVEYSSILGLCTCPSNM